MKCKCGFEFAGSGELRTSEAFIADGRTGSICPDCGKHYIQLDTGDVVEIVPIEELNKITEVDVIDTICELNKQIEQLQAKIETLKKQWKNTE